QTNALQRQLMGLQIAQGAVGLQQTLARQKALQDLFASERGGQPAQPPQLSQGSQPSEAVAVPQDASAITYTSPDQIKAATMLAALDPSKNPQDVLEKQRDLQIKAAQQAQAPVLARYDDVVHSDSPTRDIRANPQLLQDWARYAPTFGIDPTTGLTDASARLVFGMAGNQIRA